MMRVPKSLKRLLSDSVVCGGIHEHHAEQHDMTSDTSGLRIMDLDSLHWANLRLLDIEKAEHS